LLLLLKLSPHLAAQENHFVFPRFVVVSTNHVLFVLLFRRTGWKNRLWRCRRSHSTSFGLPPFVFFFVPALAFELLRCRLRWRLSTGRLRLPRGWCLLGRSCAAHTYSIELMRWPWFRLTLISAQHSAASKLCNSVLSRIIRLVHADVGTPCHLAVVCVDLYYTPTLQ